MDPTPEQKQAFGTALTTAREAAGLSVPALAGELRDAGFPKVRHQHVYNWQKVAPPKDRAIILKLDDLLGTGGRLLAVLDGADVANLDSRLSRVERLVDQLLELVPLLPDTSSGDDAGDG